MIKNKDFSGNSFPKMIVWLTIMVILGVILVNFFIWTSTIKIF